MADNLNEEEWWEEKSGNEIAAKKRKVVVANDDDNDENLQEGKENNDTSSKKQQKKKKKKPQKKKLVKQDIIDSSTLWKFFENSTKGKLSQMELDELKPSNIDECFLNDTLELHTSLDQISSFLLRVIPRWPKDMKSVKEHRKGSPVLLIICGSARRAVDLCRAIKGFKTPSCKTAKLFAKHLKLEEQQVFLSKSIVHIGVGTPNRINKLVSDGFLKLTKLKYVVFDWSYKDPKERKMSDIPEVRKDIINFLQQEVFHLLKEGKLRFGLF